MAGDFEVRGVEDVDKLVRAIRTHADAKALRKELFSGLNRHTKELRGRMIQVIPAALPKRGGLAAEFQKGTTARTTAKSGKYAGVSVWFRNKNHDIRTLTGKRLRHPVYGNRNRWVTQTKGVDPAVFIGKFEQQKPEILRAILDVMNEVARKVTS
jgi:hypothetical protein